jgi:hypothetical protein
VAQSNKSRGNPVIAPIYWFPDGQKLATGAALLTLISLNWLFAGTVLAFSCSAALVVSVTVPQPAGSERTAGLYDNTTRGIRIYLKTPRLRGLLAQNISVAAAGAMVIVNSVIIVKTLLGGSDREFAVALACFGGAPCRPVFIQKPTFGTIKPNDCIGP